MSDPLEMLEIIDEDENIIGLETRIRIHQEGLLHREINIWFITPNEEIIFQHRAKDKDAFPDKLDATVGGHVEPNMSYEETAIKECKEETGIDIVINKLVFLSKIRQKTFDELTGKTNNTIRYQYAYLYGGLVGDLQIEKGKSEGFEAWKIDDLLNLSENDENKFITIKDMVYLFDKTKDILLG